VCRGDAASTVSRRETASVHARERRRVQHARKSTGKSDRLCQIGAARPEHGVVRVETGGRRRRERRPWAAGDDGAVLGEEEEGGGGQEGSSKQTQ